jgi:predicted nucleic acid-binding protein
VWIAAAAMETGSRLIAFDRDFERIPGLAVDVLINPGR